MQLLHAMTLTTALSTLLLAAPQTGKNEPVKEIVQTGKAATKLLLKTLGSNMKKNMKAGGPMQALDFCSQKAYTLTEDVNKELPKGVSIKRISLRYRNPVNEPAADEKAVLESLEDLKKAAVILPKHIVQKVNANEYKFYKPLVINKKVCLKCHGTLKDMELKRAIEERYPLDKAMGYKMGDLRGAVVVTIKK